MKWICAVACWLSLLTAAETLEQARTAILSAYQQSLEALSRGDADQALSIDTADWTSHVTGQKPRTKAELELFIRRDIASLKPPPSWTVVWKPDYVRNGTTSGIQLYDIQLDGDSAVVLCLVGNTRDGVWTGSHVRDTWVRTHSGWKRRMHEKLTVNERLVKGKPSGNGSATLSNN